MSDEQSYLNGYRMALNQILTTILRNLGYDDLTAQKANWITEREAALNQLRDLCATFGDNDWDETSHLADIIEKHLARHLFEDKEKKGL